jgi:hypothetical protein
LVNAHHGHEDSTFFPGLIKLTGREDMVSAEQELHRILHEGLERFEDWIRGVEADLEKWSWDGESGLKAVLDSFTDAFMKHLRDEIDMLRSLKDYDSQKLLELWDRTEDEAKKSVNKNTLVRSLIPRLFVKNANG